MMLCEDFASAYQISGIKNVHELSINNKSILINTNLSVVAWLFSDQNAPRLFEVLSNVNTD
jgi:hypothetical protein